MDYFKKRKKKKKALRMKLKGQDYEDSSLKVMIMPPPLLGKRGIKNLKREKKTFWTWTLIPIEKIGSTFNAKN